MNKKSYGGSHTNYRSGRGRVIGRVVPAAETIGIKGRARDAGLRSRIEKQPRGAVTNRPRHDQIIDAGRATGIGGTGAANRHANINDTGSSRKNITCETTGAGVGVAGVATRRTALSRRQQPLRV